jgi:hypothetical protein
MRAATFLTDPMESPGRHAMHRALKRAVLDRFGSPLRVFEGSIATPCIA